MGNLIAIIIAISKYIYDRHVCIEMYLVITNDTVL